MFFFLQSNLQTATNFFPNIPTYVESFINSPLQPLGTLKVFTIFRISWLKADILIMHKSIVTNFLILLPYFSKTNQSAGADTLYFVNFIHPLTLISYAIR